MKRFIIILATVLWVWTGHGICEENPAKMVKHVDTIYLLNANGSILNKYNDVVITSHKRDEQIVHFIHNGKKMYHEGNVLMKGVELRKNRAARQIQKTGIE
jgi:hypothetical protein